MTLSIEQARALVAKGNPPFVNDRFTFMRAVGMLEGWDAAVRKCAESVKYEQCEDAHCCSGYCRNQLVNKIESLSPPSEERKSKEEKEG